MVHNVSIAMDINYSKAIGRPREFDLSEVTRCAMNVFWDNGYHNTSLSELLEGMKLSRGSFYKAFGDKKTVFHRALEMYSDDAIKNVREILNADIGPKESIRNAFLRYADLSAGPKGHRGCLAVLTAAEMCPGDPETSIRIDNHFKKLQKLFADAIRRGQAIGEIKNPKDAETIALFIVSHAQGMRVLGKVGKGEDQMLENIDLAMGVLF